MVKSHFKYWFLSLFLTSIQVTSVDLHCHFHALGAGIIEDVRVQRDKGFGFVRYSTHTEASLAIQMGNARILSGKPIKVPYLLEDYILCYNYRLALCHGLNCWDEVLL